MVDAKTQVTAALQMAKAVADTIRELKEVSSGHLYAQLVGTFSIQQYDQLIGFLKRTGLIEETGSHLLRWVG